MLIRENAADLHPGAYLVAAGRDAVSVDFDELRRLLVSALRKVQYR